MTGPSTWGGGREGSQNKYCWEWGGVEKCLLVSQEGLLPLWETQELLSRMKDRDARPRIYSKKIYPCWLTHRVSAQRGKTPLPNSCLILEPNAQAQNCSPPMTSQPGSGKQCPDFWAAVPTLR